MKKLIFILIVSIIYSACTSRTAGIQMENKDSSSVALPYTAAYSSKFSVGKDSNSLMVLNNYKAWEDGDMNAFKNTLSDSFTIYFADGGKFSGTRDSAMILASAFRDSISKVELKIDAWVPLHSEDRNEDWVSVWYKEIDTYKNGKIDSAYYQDDNMLDKNGKIVFTAIHKQVLK